ncbi:uncharacterized protein F4817DRAFT_344611 [Daldinia loculata]|uniref:uncharacterized protein n=1 Tax=Daldinia loculata TaxID=103429 RepID=UPI0020C2F158|nr:uncharacterized protein F4817DRAFT_344611 [Daldinia loculata]KAI1645027.1 hypothetical protein F4817DRAFT_344611 [Daldinia loculata]
MDSTTNSSANPVLQTSPPLLKIEAFHGIIWAGFALCVLAFAGRVTVRVICFHRFFLEDCLMLTSLCFLLATAILAQFLLQFVYNMEAVGNGTMLPPPTFLDDTSRALRGFAALMLLNYTGIWLIKFNFLWFFRRLGNNIARYRISWWCVLIFNIGAGVTAIGLIDFKCLVPPSEYIFTNCEGYEKVLASNTAAIVSCSLDAISDALIICFPISILWGVRIGLRKKIILSAIFSLVAFTIAVTIVRGSIFGGVYKSVQKDNLQSMNVTWIWFWFSMEYIVSFLIACLISFRSLFVQDTGTNEARARAREREHRGVLGPTSKPKSLRVKARMFHDSVLDTLMTLEGPTRVGQELTVLPQPVEGRIPLNIREDEGWSDADKSTHTRPDSIRGLL